jgi:hypothetical protein
MRFGAQDTLIIYASALQSTSIACCTLPRAARRDAVPPPPPSSQRQRSPAPAALRTGILQLDTLPALPIVRLLLPHRRRRPAAGGGPARRVQSAGPGPSGSRQFLRRPAGLLWGGCDQGGAPRAGRRFAPPARPGMRGRRWRCSPPPRCSPPRACFTRAPFRPHRTPPAPRSGGDPTVATGAA